MDTLFINVIKLSMELDQATADLDPTNPATLDRVRSVLSKLEVVIQAASAELNNISTVIETTQTFLDAAEALYAC